MSANCINGVSFKLRRLSISQQVALSTTLLSLIAALTLVGANQDLNNLRLARSEPNFNEFQSQRLIRQSISGEPFNQAHLKQQPRQIIVPGTPLNPFDDGLITQVIFPSDAYQATSDLSVSNVIDHKRFVEAVSSRCFASTLLEDPASVEPSFIVVKPGSEMRINATAPIGIIESTGFEPNKKTVILVHGFTQSYPSTDWLRHTRALFEKHTKLPHLNLIIMDWGRAADGSYAQVAARVSGMGSFLANFLMKLLEMGTDRMQIHLIGHSLGAHVSGFAGKRIRPRIGRITALDAAGPCFGKIFSNSPTDRLSPDDAYEVDVYHYDDTFLGLPGQNGQFDIYVNGGSSQPGCKDNANTMFNALLTMMFRRNRPLSESHTRSTEVATSQLSQTGCQLVAYECRDYSSFLSGECGKCDNSNSQCFLMSFDYQYMDIHDQPLRTSFPGKKLYVSTGSDNLYCMHHYQILVKFEPTPDLAKRKKWRLQLELINDIRENLNLTLTNQMAPNVFSYLLSTNSQPIRIKAARLLARASDGSSIIVTHQIVPTLKKGEKPVHRVFGIDVNFMSNINPDIRRSLSSHLCPISSKQSDINDIADSGSGSHSEHYISFIECR